MQDPILDSHAPSAAASPWARIFLLAALGLAPLFLIPINGFPFALSKMALFAILLTLCAIFLGLAALRQGSLSIPLPKVMLAMLGLVGAYALATALSQDWKLSLAGAGAEVDTLLFIGAAALSAILVSILFASRSAAQRLLYVIGGSALIVALFQFVRIFADPLFKDSVFSSVANNLVGGFNDFGTVMGLLVILCAARIDTKAGRPMMRVIFGAVLIAALFLVALVNFSMLWWALAAASLCVAYACFFNTSATHESKFSRIPFASLIVFVLAAAFIFFGSALSAQVQKIAQVQQGEAQLTLPTTLEVTRATYAQSALTTFFGSGPNTFAQQWLLYKPASLTNSDFWTLDFGAGFSTIATAFLTAGLAGGIIFLLIPLFLLMLFFRASGRIHDQAERNLFIAASGAAILLWGMLCLYAPGQVVVLLAFALLGLLVSLSGFRSEHTLKLSGHTINQAALALVVLACIAGASALSQRLLGSIYHGRALVAASVSDMARAESYAMRSLSVYRSEESLHLLATLKFTQAQNIAAETDKATESTRANRLKDALAQSSDYANAAVKDYPTHWGNWLTLAQLYEALIPLKVEGAYQESASAYNNAIRLSPRNPELYLMAARMEATAGNEQNARTAVSQALTLKQNYTDAILFIVQLEVQKKNLDAAMNAAAAAVQTSPSNAGLWFQLGALAYEKGDNETAVGALAQAIKLAPDYANAKYFLGLVYYRQNKLGDAVAIFEELAKQNPDNQQVASILADMKSGKPAPAPTTAPVKEN